MEPLSICNWTNKISHACDRYDAHFGSSLTCFGWRSSSSTRVPIFWYAYIYPLRRLDWSLTKSWVYVSVVKFSPQATWLITTKPTDYRGIYLRHERFGYNKKQSAETDVIREKAREKGVRSLWSVTLISRRAARDSIIGWYWRYLLSALVSFFLLNIACTDRRYADRRQNVPCVGYSEYSGYTVRKKSHPLWRMPPNVPRVSALTTVMRVRSHY